MRNDETNNMIQQNQPDNQMMNNLINQNEMKVNNQPNHDDLDDIDDNLGFNNQNNYNAGSFFRPRIDSSNSVFKYSVESDT